MSLFSLKIESTIAVTIGMGSSGFRLMARYAAESCSWATKLPTYIVGKSALRRFSDLTLPHRLKFKLFDLFPEAQTIVYFDADTSFLKRVDLNPLIADGRFCCVLDAVNQWSTKDSEAIGVPITEYFNSGFFIAHRQHKAIFEKADTLYRAGVKTVLHDQGYLNLARFKLQIPTHFLSRHFNIIDFGPEKKTPDSILAHFNGSNHLKEAEIEARYRQWSPAFGLAKLSWPDLVHSARRLTIRAGQK